MYSTIGYLFSNMSRHQLNSKDKRSSFVACKDGHGLKLTKIGPAFSSFNAKPNHQKKSKSPKNYFGYKTWLNCLRAKIPPEKENSCEHF